MLTLLAGCLALGAAPLRSDDDWTVKAGVVYSVSKAPIENGVVRVEDGKITAVSKGGGGGNVLECAAVTPGLVDLSVQIDTGAASVEQARETVARLSVADALDLFSFRWERELRSGVTTALANPLDMDVLGGFGVVVKTGGEPTLERRLLRANAVLRGAIGTQPSSGNAAPRGQEPVSFYFRRPTTRMAVEWVARDAFYRALQGVGSEDPAQAEENAILKKVLAGEIVLMLQAKATQDVRTAIYLKEEFGIPRLILDHAVECWREPELLVRSGAAVVLPPFVPGGRHLDGSVPDSYFLPLEAARMLADLGVPFALSGHGQRDVGARLSDQAGFAMRGGLSFDAALAAVTLTPATLAGVADRVGSLEVGKDADLVLWNGTPFEPTSRVIGVLLDGELVLDPRTR